MNKTNQTADKYTLGPDCDNGCLDQGIRVCEHKTASASQNPRGSLRKHKTFHEKMTQAKADKAACERGLCKGAALFANKALEYKAQRDESLAACKYAVAKLPYATAMVAAVCRRAIANVEAGQ
jgi:hypothetical protein